MNPTLEETNTLDVQQRLSTCATLAERAQSIAEQTAGRLNRDGGPGWLLASAGRLAEAARTLDGEAQALLVELGVHQD